MHILLTFQLIIRRLFFIQAFSTLWCIPTNQPQHFLFIDNNESHHSITYHSYFTTFSHSSPFTISPTPPTPSPFPDHQSSYLLLLLSTPLHQRAASRVQHPNHVAANSFSPQVARKDSTLSGFVQRSRLEREVGRDLHSNKWEEV